MNDDKTDSVINIELPERFARHGSLGLLSRAIFVLVGFVALFVLFFPFYLSIVLNLIYGDYKLSDHVLGKNDSSFVVPVWHTGLTVDSRIHQVAEPLDRESAEKLLPDTSMSRQVVLNDVLTTAAGIRSGVRRVLWNGSIEWALEYRFVPFSDGKENAEVVRDAQMTVHDNGTLGRPLIVNLYQKEWKEPGWQITLLRYSGWFPATLALNPLIVLGLLGCLCLNPKRSQFSQPVYSRFTTVGVCGMVAVFNLVLWAVYFEIGRYGGNEYWGQRLVEQPALVAWSPVAGFAAGYAWMLVLRRYTRIKPWMGVLLLFVAHAVQFQWAITLEKLL